MERIEFSFGAVAAAVSTITIFEVNQGIYRAQDPLIRDRRRHWTDLLFRHLVIHPLSADIADLAASITADQSRRGINIPVQDLLIGCTALSAGYDVLTFNMRHFQMIPGLTVKTL